MVYVVDVFMEIITEGRHDPHFSKGFVMLHSSNTFHGCDWAYVCVRTLALMDRSLINYKPLASLRETRPELLTLKPIVSNPHPPKDTCSVI